MNIDFLDTRVCSFEDNSKDGTPRLILAHFSKEEPTDDDFFTQGTDLSISVHNAFMIIGEKKRNIMFWLKGSTIEMIENLIKEKIEDDEN